MRWHDVTSQLSVGARIYLNFQNKLCKIIQPSAHQLLFFQSILICFKMYSLYVYYIWCHRYLFFFITASNLQTLLHITAPLYNINCVSLQQQFLTAALFRGETSGGKRRLCRRHFGWITVDLILSTSWENYERIGKSITRIPWDQADLGFLKKKSNFEMTMDPNFVFVYPVYFLNDIMFFLHNGNRNMLPRYATTVSTITWTPLVCHNKGQNKQNNREKHGLLPFGLSTLGFSKFHYPYRSCQKQGVVRKRLIIPRKVLPHDQ